MLFHPLLRATNVGGCHPYFWRVRTPDNRVSSVIERYRLDLAALYPEPEVKAIVRTVFSERLGWDASEMEIKKFESLSESELLKVYLPLKRLIAGEPLQYILGEVRFHGLRLKVDRSVLIPRPETEELVDLIISTANKPPARIVDIGTGSGCIALALKKAFPSAEVIAIDTSSEALDLAKRNGDDNDLDVQWMEADVLDPSFALPTADLVVSNPPYIPSSEEGSLATHVTDHEPYTALFVPDDDPLLFYRVIAANALNALPTGGSLWFEGHFLTAPDVVHLLRSAGWREVEVFNDLSGNARFIHAVR